MPRAGRNYLAIAGSNITAADAQGGVAPRSRRRVDFQQEQRWIAALPDFGEALIQTISVADNSYLGPTVTAPVGGYNFTVWKRDASQLWCGYAAAGKIDIYTYNRGSNQFVLLRTVTVDGAATGMYFLRMSRDGSTCWANTIGDGFKFYGISTTTYAVSAAVVPAGGWGVNFQSYDFFLSDDGTTAYVGVLNFSTYLGGAVWPMNLSTGVVGATISGTKPDPGRVARNAASTQMAIASYNENVIDLLTFPGGVVLHSWSPGQGGGLGDPGAVRFSPDGTMLFVPVSDGSPTIGGGLVVSTQSPYSTIATVANYPNNYHANICTPWTPDGKWIYTNWSGSAVGPSGIVQINPRTGAVAAPLTYGDINSGSYGFEIAPDLTRPVVYDGQRFVCSAGA